jgi:hypothetical protein
MTRDAHMTCQVSVQRPALPCFKEHVSQAYAATEPLCSPTNHMTLHVGGPLAALFQSSEVQASLGQRASLERWHLCEL